MTIDAGGMDAGETLPSDAAVRDVGSPPEDAGPKCVTGPDECDGVDTDCDGAVDEDGLSRWYVDCDEDGFSPSAVVSVDSCAAPPSPPAACTTGRGVWTTADPGVAADCCDEDDRAHPGAGWTASGTAMGTTDTPAPIACGGYDFDCDGMTERRWPMNRGACGVVPLCVLDMGWRGLMTPACGESACWISSCMRGPLSCVATCDPTRTFQDCR